MIRLGCFFLLGVALLTPGGAGSADNLADSTAKLVYATDFADGAGEHWSNRKVETTPQGARKFLGQFSNESVRLTLRDLPPHARVRVSFELFLIRSWDGSHAQHGPDTFGLRVAGGPRLVYATFWNGEGADMSQSFPAAHGVQENRGYTGAAEINSLGFQLHGTPWDAVYRIQRTFAHSDDTLALDFSAEHLEDIGNESWGLGGVRVEVLPAPSANADAQAIAAAWSDLLEDDALKADAACEFFSAAGPAGLEKLAQLEAASRERASDANRLETIPQLIEELDDDEFQVRQRAYMALQELGGSALPELERALRGAPSPEKRMRVARLIGEHQSIRAPAETRRVLRLIEALERIGGPEAKERLTALARGACGPEAADQAGGALLRLNGG